jgi:hypothetical protein
VHVPQARVGARPASAAMEWGAVGVMASGIASFRWTSKPGFCRQPELADANHSIYSTQKRDG